MQEKEPIVISQLEFEVAFCTSLEGKKLISPLELEVAFCNSRVTLQSEEKAGLGVFPVIFTNVRCRLPQPAVTSMQCRITLQSPMWGATPLSPQCKAERANCRVSSHLHPMTSPSGEKSEEKCLLKGKERKECFST